MNIVLCDFETNLVRIFTSTRSYLFDKKSTTIFSKIDSSNILVAQKLSLVSKQQFLSWIGLSSCSDKIVSTSAKDVIEMPLLLYDDNSNTFYICSIDNGIWSFNYNKKNTTKLPKQMGYIEEAHLMNKQQFITWLNEQWQTKENISNSEIYSLPKQEFIPSQEKEEEYLHACYDGTVLIEDIRDKDNNLLQLQGKYHFVPVSSIGKDRLSASIHYQILRKKGKVEIVNEEYVQKNKHKYKPITKHNSMLPVGSVDDFLNKNDDMNTINL